MTTGAASPRQFRVGNRVRFVDAPLSAQFIPAGTTGIVTDRLGYRAFEITCDGTPIPVTDFPENLQKSAQAAPYMPTTVFVSKRKRT